MEKTSTFILVAHTTGDELIMSTQKMVMASADKVKLENLRAEREKERKEYLGNTPIPTFAASAIISHETIEEVETL
jgi:hypothetical protein